MCFTEGALNLHGPAGVLVLDFVCFSLICGVLSEVTLK